jgi:hypothetical protein
MSPKTVQGTKPKPKKSPVVTASLFLLVAACLTLLAAALLSLVYTAVLAVIFSSAAIVFAVLSLRE